MKVALALGFVAWLLIASTVQAAPVTVAANATHVLVHTAGPINGTLGALLIEGDFASTAQRIPGFQLTASSLTLETDESDPTLFVPGVIEVYGIDGTTIRTVVEELGASTVIETAGRAHYRIDVFALSPNDPPQVQVVSGCSEVQSSDVATLVRAPRANIARPDSVVSTADDLLVEPCGDGMLHVTGSFVMSLWESDAMLQHGAEQRALTTGPERSASNEQGPGLHPVVSRYEEVYLKAYGATLSVPWTSSMRLFLTGATLSGAASLELNEASGTFETTAGAVPVEGEDVYLQGIIQAAFMGGGVGLPLRSDVSGDVGSARVGATQLDLGSVTARAPAAPGAATLLWMGVLLVCLVVAVVAIRRQRIMHRAGMALAPTLPRRQRNAVALWHAAADCLDRQRWRRALRFATRARRADPESVDAKYAWAVAQHRLARRAKALEMYQEIHPKLDPGHGRAENAAAIALSLAELGRSAEALVWLRSAFADDPEVAQAWGRDRAFDALAQNAWLRSLRNPRGSVDPAFG